MINFLDLPIRIKRVWIWRGLKFKFKFLSLKGQRFHQFLNDLSIRVKRV